MNEFKLDNEPKIRTGFKVPDGYFESLTDKVMQQIPEPEVKTIPLYHSFTTWYAAAAAVLLLAFGAGLYFKPGTGETQPDNSAIESYLVYQANISNYDLYQSLDDDDIKDLEQSIVISDDAIEEYITVQGNYEYYLNE
jgi:hypothetical protein